MNCIPSIIRPEEKSDTCQSTFCALYVQALNSQIYSEFKGSKLASTFRVKGTMKYSSRAKKAILQSFRVELSLVCSGESCRLQKRARFANFHRNNFHSRQIYRQASCWRIYSDLNFLCEFFGLSSYFFSSKTAKFRHPFTSLPHYPFFYTRRTSKFFPGFGQSFWHSENSQFKRWVFCTINF